MTSGERIFKALRWTHSRASMFFCKWGDKRGTAYSRMGITKALYRREKTSLFPGPTFLLRKPTILLALFTTFCVWVFQDTLEVNETPQSTVSVTD